MWVRSGRWEQEMLFARKLYGPMKVERREGVKEVGAADAGVNAAYRTQARQPGCLEGWPERSYTLPWKESLSARRYPRSCETGLSNDSSMFVLLCEYYAISTALTPKNVTIASLARGNCISIKDFYERLLAEP
jgi:hypothetical protein